MRNYFILYLVLVLSLAAGAQTDTLFNKTMDEVVVTATRTERKLGNVAVPVSIISQQTMTNPG